MAKRLTGRESPLELIQAANEIDLYDVLAEFFEVHLPREGKSGKQPCPFGFEHPDGGMDKAFRTYPDGNHAYCFGGHGYLDPVRLIQIKDDISATAAARRLLEHYNVLNPMPYWERFAEVQREVASRRTEVGDTSYAVEALSVALRAHPAHAQGQYSSQYSESFSRCLEVLNHLSKVRPDQADAKLSEWFDRSKALMLRTLDALPANEEHATLDNSIHER